MQCTQAAPRKLKRRFTGARGVYQVRAVCSEGFVEENRVVRVRMKV
jgi:hypothetical protein